MTTGLAAGFLCAVLVLSAGAAISAPVTVEVQRSAPLPPVSGIAVRTADVGYKEGVNLVARANEALRRHGITPDIAGPATLTLRLVRPVTWTAPGQGRIHLDGRIGSSSKPSLALEFTLPDRERAIASGPRSVVLSGTLESDRGTVLWHATARTAMDADGTADDADRRAVDALVGALARLLRPLANR